MRSPGDGDLRRGADMRDWRGTRRVTVTGASSGCCSARHNARSISPMRSAVADGAPVFFEHVVQIELKPSPSA